MRSVDQVVGRVGKEGDAAGCSRPSRLWVRQRSLAGYHFGEDLVVQCFQILTHGTVAECRVRPVDCFSSLHAVLVTRIRRDQTGVHGEAFALDETLSHAAADHFVEDPAEGLAGTKASMTILGEGGVVWHGIFQAKTTEPAIGQVEMDFFAQASFRTNAVTITNDQHADHWSGIGRRTASMAVVIRQVLA